MAADRETVEALARKYHEPRAAARAFALALTHAQSGLRHLGISPDEAVLFERLASRVLGTDGSLRAGAETIAANELGQSGLWPHGISGDLPILLVRVIGDEAMPLVRQALQAQEYWRLKGVRADVVIVNEHPASYLDEMHAQLTAVLNDGPWRTWQHRPGGAYLLRADRMGQAERVLLEAVAGAILRGDRGDLRAHSSHRRGTGRAAGARRSSPTLAGTRRTATPSLVPAPPMTLANGLGGFADRRADLRDRPRRDGRHADAVGERDRQPALRHHRDRVGRGAHLGRQQPREPADAVRQRSDQRSDRRGAVHSRRGDRRSVVADARARSRGRRRAARSSGTAPA